MASVQAVSRSSPQAGVPKAGHRCTELDTMVQWKKWKQGVPVPLRPSATLFPVIKILLEAVTGPTGPIHRSPVDRSPPRACARQSSFGEAELGRSTPNGQAKR